MSRDDMVPALLLTLLITIVVGSCFGIVQDVQYNNACEERCHPHAWTRIQNRCACAAEDGWWQVQP